VRSTAFIKANTKVPTGSINDWMAPYCLLTLARRTEEQGEWAAQTALLILDGTPISSIAVAENLPLLFPAPTDFALATAWCIM
jgi:hypothetical protein